MSGTEEYNAKTLLIELMGKETAERFIKWAHEVRCEDKHRGEVFFLYGPRRSGKKTIVNLFKKTCSTQSSSDETIPKDIESYPTNALKTAEQRAYFHIVKDVNEGSALLSHAYRSRGVDET